MTVPDKRNQDSNEAVDSIKTIEIIDAVKRSGYLLENRILSKFLKNNFTAEANHVIFLNSDDTKYREIDVLASKYIDSIQLKDISNISLFVHFIIECINNSQPLGLFDNLGDRDEPSSDWTYSITNGDAEIQELLSIIIPGIIHDYENKYEEYLPSKQYCSFLKKKGDHKKDQWMAYHPDDFHKTLSKLVDCVKFKLKDSNDKWEGRQPQNTRLDFFIPVIILQNDLIKIHQIPDVEVSLEIEKLEFHRLKTSYDDSYNRNLSIDIVQEKYFDEFLISKLSVLSALSGNLRARIK